MVDCSFWLPQSVWMEPTAAPAMHDLFPVSSLQALSCPQLPPHPPHPHHHYTQHPNVVCGLQSWELTKSTQIYL